GDPVLGVVEVQVGAGCRAARAAVGVGPEQVAQVDALHLAVVGDERVPLRGADSAGHAYVCWPCSRKPPPHAACPVVVGAGGWVVVVVGPGPPPVPDPLAGLP